MIASYDIKELSGKGALSAVCTVTASAPLVRVQLMLQAHNELLRSGRLETPGYTGAFNCLMRTYRTEGLSSLWRGNVVSCIAHISSLPVRLAGLDYVMRRFKSDTDSEFSRNAKLAFASGTVNVVGAALVYPLTYCRIRMANDIVNSRTGERQFGKGSFSVLNKTLQADGLSGVFRGFFVSSMAFYFHGACVMGFHSLLLRAIHKEQDYVVRPGLFFAVGFPLLAGFLAYPFDTVRVRMMMRSCEPVKYRGALDCVKQVIRQESALNLWNGVLVNFTKALYLATLLLCYSNWRDQYGEHLPGFLRY